ncbi:MAG: 4Fe-4S binding protein [Gemmatimonadetes bacterium]|nr:4Fe-4S binding protein [Gemmatimonadota bacterium]
MIAPADLAVSVAVLGGVATVFGAFISLANAKFKVYEDPRIDGVRDLLPGNDCGACGQAGCRAFAEALVKGEIAPATCTVASAGAKEDIADYLGVAAGEANKRVARLLCAGGRDVAPYKGSYHGVESCGAAAAVTGGGKACAWGCLGFADCAVACDFDAIVMSPNGLPVVDPEKCTACGDCVDACPLGLFVLMPENDHLLVQCKNLLSGEAAEAVCSVACNACGRCAADAPGLITMVGGLAVIDYDKIELENPKAVERCPTGAIVWIEGQQFPEILVPAGSEA